MRQSDTPASSRFAISGRPDKRAWLRKGHRCSTVWSR
jgi:hypothetical protein